MSVLVLTDKDLNEKRFPGDNTTYAECFREGYIRNGYDFGYDIQFTNFRFINSLGISIVHRIPVFGDNVRITCLMNCINRKRINGVCDAVVNGGIDGEGGYLSEDEHIYQYRLERGGLKKLGFSVSVDNKPAGSIRLKLSRWPKDLTGEEGLQNFNPDFYNQFVRDGVPLKIPYSKVCTREFRVLRPIDLLAVKIALGRPKDDMDIGNLVRALQLTGEFFPTPESLRTNGYSLRERLVPCYEEQLGRFASKYGLDIPSASQSERARLAQG